MGHELAPQDVICDLESADGAVTAGPAAAGN
jgi:hypothetical protein